MLVDGTWHYGELRMWTHHRDGSWSANVKVIRVSGANRIAIFAPKKIRPLSDT